MPGKIPAFIPNVTTYVSSEEGWYSALKAGTWQGRPIKVKSWDGGVSPLDNSYGPFVPGETVAIDTGLIGYTAKGLPSGLKLDKKSGIIKGTPKKPTAVEGAAVTFSKRGDETFTTKIIVGPIPRIDVELMGDTEKCKVMGGNKSYLFGKKVNLTAKGPKGTAFRGWFLDGQPWPNEEEYLNAKIKYVMTADDLLLTAAFEKEKMSIDASSLESAEFTMKTAVAQDTIVLDVETQSGLKSLRAKKLPLGLRLAKNRTTGSWSIYGTPKKAGTFDVTITATAKSGAVETKIVQITVEEAPSPLAI